MDKVDIYRVCEKNGSSFLHEEVCRNCAKDFQKKGFEIEFDKHLFKYVEEIEGITYYLDGSDEKNPEIVCSQCESYLFSEHEEILEGS